jgi:hypothetical protein
MFVEYRVVMQRTDGRQPEAEAKYYSSGHDVGLKIKSRRRNVSLGETVSLDLESRDLCGFGGG